MKEAKLFNYYDVCRKYDDDSDDLLKRADIQKMMFDSGMKYVTVAEATFVFKIISNFKKSLNSKTFENWAVSMEGLG